MAYGARAISYCSLCILSFIYHTGSVFPALLSHAFLFSSNCSDFGSSVITLMNLSLNSLLVHATVYLFFTATVRVTILLVALCEMFTKLGLLVDY